MLKEFRSAKLNSRRESVVFAIGWIQTRQSAGALSGSVPMSNKSRARPSPNAWRPLQMQLIAFPSAAPISTQQDWWRDVGGQEPAESIRKPRERADTGPLADCSLTLTVDLLKITWTIAPRLDPETPPDSFVALAPYPEARDRFIQLVRPWLSELCPAIRRLGVGAVLIQDTESHADAYRLLDTYLPAIDVDPESTDFLYRVNRRRRSHTSIHNLYINRLTSWSAMSFTTTVQSINPGLPTHNRAMAIGEPRFAAMLNLDINSEAEREDDLPLAERSELLDELAALATEIATEGDVR
jgi:hypothetical protein